MTRKYKGGLYTVVIFSVLVGLGCDRTSGTSRGSGPRPNVILYLIDTLRADHLGAYGYEPPTSPNLDSFALEASVFTRTYAPASWTRPSVGSLFTGRFPSRHGAIRREDSLRRDIPTLAEILKQSGYSTVGFLTNPNVFPIFGFERGFDDVIEFEVDTDAETLHASVIDYLKRPPQGPVFMYIHSMDPHAPYTPPLPFERRFLDASLELKSWMKLMREDMNRDRQDFPDPSADLVKGAIGLYDAAIAYADEQLGHLFDRFREMGVYENSIIIVVSDHGEEFGEHGSWLHGATLYQEQLLVPLIIRLPHGRGAGQRIDAPVRIVDLLPTLADYLGIPLPTDIEGKSFLQLLLGVPGGSYEPVLYSEENLDRRILSSLVEGDYKLIESARTPADPNGSIELFDLAQDPGEMRSLVDAEPEITASLREKLKSLESMLRGGVYIEFRNAAHMEELHHVRGTIEVIGGTFKDWEATALDEEDRVDVDSERKRATFSLFLRNDENPKRWLAKRLVDLDRIYFRLDPPEATYRLELWLEDDLREPLGCILGGSLALTKLLHPIELSPSDPRISLVGPRREWKFPPQFPHCRIYALPEAHGPRVEIDEDLDNRLRGLGYLGDE